MRKSYIQRRTAPKRRVGLKRSPLPPRSGFILRKTPLKQGGSGIARGGGIKRTARPNQKSARRKVEEIDYGILSNLYFAAHPTCEIPGFGGSAEEIHHTAGRYGGNYLRTATWRSASNPGHRWVHHNPKAAYANGCLVYVPSSACFVPFGHQRIDWLAMVDDPARISEAAAQLVFDPIPAAAIESHPALIAARRICPHFLLPQILSVADSDVPLPGTIYGIRMGYAQGEVDLIMLMETEGMKPVAARYREHTSIIVKAA